MRDLRVDVALEGDFEAAHLEGDNTGLLATDTMRNTRYALAKEHSPATSSRSGSRSSTASCEAGPSVRARRAR